MTTNIPAGALTQPAIIAAAETIARNVAEWWSAESETATTLMGEPTTRARFLTANACLLLGLVAVMAAVAVVNHLFGMEGGAL